MSTLSTIALTLSIGLAAASTPHDFLHPQAPLSPGEHNAPSANVTNGTTFESGAITLAEGQALCLPKGAVIEEHDGATVRFFLTKSLGYLGQSPVEMHFEKSRDHFGLAQRSEGDVVMVSTFGEWSNRGGAASIRLLVMVPRGLKVTQDKGLGGGASRASSKFELSDKALDTCYWHAGPRPKEGWKRIGTSLHYSRFLKPL